MHTDSSEAYDPAATAADYTAPAAVYANVMLCDVTAETGATECCARPTWRHPRRPRAACLRRRGPCFLRVFVF